jgi:hypothetical protein
MCGVKYSCVHSLQSVKRRTVFIKEYSRVVRGMGYPLYLSSSRFVADRECGRQSLSCIKFQHPGHITELPELILRNTELKATKLLAQYSRL